MIVQVKVKEGNRERLQARRCGDRQEKPWPEQRASPCGKISAGTGVERTFKPTLPPLVAQIDVKRRGDVRRAKLYFCANARASPRSHQEKLPAKTAA